MVRSGDISIPTVSWGAINQDKVMINKLVGPEPILGWLLAVGVVIVYRISPYKLSASRLEHLANLTYKLVVSTYVCWFRV